MSVLLFVKYVLPLVLPFFLALILVTALRPALQRLERRLHVGKRFLAVGLLLLVLILLGAALWYGSAALLRQSRQLIGNLELYERELDKLVQSCCRGMERSMGIRAEAMEALILTRLDELTEGMKHKAALGLMDHSVAYGKRLCSAAGFVLMTLIAAILLAKDFEEIRERLERYPWFVTAREIGTDMGRLAGHYVRAQGIILCVISILCMVGLYAAGVGNAVLTGLAAGALDALPFIGTGFVLIPAAVWQLLGGRLWSCIWILALYGLCALTRELLEPRLLGRKMGIYPVMILFAIYTGIRLYGLSGVVLGPFSFLLIREIGRRL